MSRVHDALRKAETAVFAPQAPPNAQPQSPEPPMHPARPAASTQPAPPLEIDDLLSRIKTIPFTPSPDASLLDVNRPNEAPAEEFRSLRTRLNHLQNLQPIHSVVITSASPAEGKSFTAANLALAQAQMEGNTTLLADFDFRRPVVHTLFQIPRSPGITDYLQGKAKLEEIVRKVEGSSLCIVPAGEAVLNPLELLNLPEAKALIENLPRVFNWVIIDTPPLLFAADANLLSTMAHGLMMVVRIGHTTIDAVTRAISSLCENNVLGIVVNGAHKGELYSKYTYYHSYYYSKGE
jgi:receptor protein-tyrosine kinase